MERHAADEARRRGAAGGRKDDGLRELERRNAARLWGGPRGLRIRAAEARRDAREGGLGDGDRAAAELSEHHGSGARRKRTRARHLAVVCRELLSGAAGTGRL